MVTAIVIPHEPIVPVQKVEFQTLTDYQTAVGGYIELVRMNNHPMVIVADEDGKAKRLPVNTRATHLWWMLNPDTHGKDYLVGDIALLGARPSGVVDDIPASLLVLLLEAPRYEVQVCLSHKLSTWVPIDSQYDNYFDAMEAIGLMQVWTPPEQVKVVAAD